MVRLGLREMDGVWEGKTIRVTGIDRVRGSNPNGSNMAAPPGRKIPVKVTCRKRLRGGHPRPWLVQKPAGRRATAGALGEAERGPGHNDGMATPIWAVQVMH